MKQTRRSVLSTISDGDDSLRDLIDRNRLNGFTVMLVGFSQLLLWRTFPDPPSTILVFLVGLSSGGLLIAIGSNVLQGKETFEGSGVNERVAWVITIVGVTIAIGMAAATVWVLFS